uniref:Uncharacterized protein n=1 Tax=viral metagenome TaxID=1070528 RepID=A0A6M3JNS0_9ZZZZ
MICPLKFNLPLQDWVNRGEWNCELTNCQWWDSQSKFNPETKQFEGQCCILTLAQLKISGGINTHPF